MAYFRAIRMLDNKTVAIPDLIDCFKDLTFDYGYLFCLAERGLIEDAGIDLEKRQLLIGHLQALIVYKFIEHLNV